MASPVCPHTFLGIGAHALFGHQAWLALPLFVAYVIGPILDWWLGEDENNPPEEIVRCWRPLLPSATHAHRPFAFLPL